MPANPVRVVVIGAGAMGGLWAGRFANAGHLVTIVDPAPALLEAIRARGMAVLGGETRVTGRITAVSTPSETDRPMSSSCSSRGRTPLMWRRPSGRSSAPTRPS